jgi:predicted phosphoribosyltransferase
VPGNEELAMGAVATGGTVVLNQDVVGPLRIPKEVIDRAVREQKTEIARREKLYRNGREPIDCAGRTVILVDDGLATGATMAAAAAAIRRHHPARVIIAAPVAAPSTADGLRAAADELVFVDTPELLFAVGQFYADFTPTTDEEVRDLLGATAETDEPLGVAIPADSISWPAT